MSGEILENYSQNIFFNRSFVIRRNSCFGFHKRRACGITDLPRNILINIFQYFNEEELRKNIIPVCRQWKYAALHPSLWKKITLRGRDVPTKYICFKIRSFPKLETILLDNILEPVEVIRQICRSNKELKTLVLWNCIGVTERCLRHLIRCCKMLETLNMSGTQFGGNVFYSELAGLPLLKSLNVSENRKFTITNLLTVVLNCRVLEELEVTKLRTVDDEVSLTDKDISFIMANISDNIKSLVLDTSNLGNASFQKIFQCDKLEKLSLYGAGNLSGEIFASLWKQLANLKHLAVRHAHHIGGEHVEKLFVDGKKNMENLRVLDFTGCWKIHDGAIKKISECCPLLKHVTLKACKSVTDVSPLLENCPKLACLNIAFCYNINLEHITHLPLNLTTVIVHENESVKNIFHNPEHLGRKLSVYICVSEYNNKMISCN